MNHICLPLLRSVKFPVDKLFDFWWRKSFTKSLTVIIIIVIALTSVFPRLHRLDGFPKCHSSTHKCRLWHSEFWSKILRPDALPGVNLLQIRKLGIFIVTPSLERLPTKVNEYHLPGFYNGVVLLLDELPSPRLRSPICPQAPSAWLLPINRCTSSQYHCMQKILTYQHTSSTLTKIQIIF